MYEYIKRSDAIVQIDRGDLLVGNWAEWAREIIWRTPYADVREVRRGEWWQTIRYWGGTKTVTYRCSKCGYGVDHTSKFCPECGAKMNILPIHHGDHGYETKEEALKALGM